MENKKEVFVYYDEEDYCFREIEEKHTESPETIVQYFGYGIEQQLNDSNEFTMYKLVPYKKLKKNVKYEFI